MKSLHLTMKSPVTSSQEEGPHSFAQVHKSASRFVTAGTRCSPEPEHRTQICRKPWLRLWTQQAPSSVESRPPSVQSARSWIVSLNAAWKLPLHRVLIKEEKNDPSGDLMRGFPNIPLNISYHNHFRTWAAPVIQQTSGWMPDPVSDTRTQGKRNHHPEPRRPHTAAQKAAV